ncbi:hypothetical protein KC353_g11114 [Hortaea werneckii]|uniref:Transcription elongation factor Eaf N-terminal domain-containing protein n=1 Tax=Hortaea werneckii TaxID=91943 RepID=A0A3M7CZB2_HORWE|nr:hypothetical protein KC353_g11114 [Hortaea werneckii]RMY57475.1 hypothetical protein D0865_03096 [Hortaea werneckii]
MAAATASTQPFDLSKPASFPIRLGSSLTHSPDAVDPYVNLRYNYKPQSLSQDASAHIKSIRSSQNKAVKLDIQDGQWSYDGRPAQDVGDNYVLILRGEGSKKEAVLERIHSGYEFNLTGTPNEADSEALRKQYPHLEDAGQATDGEDLFGDEANDEEPLDPSNPFDYRHHLNTALADHHNKQQELPPTSKPTPRSQPTRPASSTPLARPTHKRQASSNLFTQQPKKRKPPTSDAPTPSQTNESNPKPSTKKPKPDSQQPKTSPSSSSSRTNKHPQSAPRQPPEIRLDRQASSVHQHNSSSSSPHRHHHEAEEDEDRASASDESGGELILENDEDSHPRRHQRQTPRPSGKQAKNAGAMSLALSGQLGGAEHGTASAGGVGGGGGGGPISLRSAASSPASRIDSPGTFNTSAGNRGLGRQQQQGGRGAAAEGLEIDLGGDGEEQEEERGGEGGGWGGDGRGYDGGEEVEDADVEDLELPSPANGTAGQDGRDGGEGGDVVVEQQEEEEEEDDLDAQLAAAMAQDDSGGGATGGGGQAEQFVQDEEEEESEEE